MIRGDELFLSSVLLSSSGSLHMMTREHAVAMPLAASAALLLLFFFFARLQWIVALCSVALGALAVAFLVQPYVRGSRAAAVAASAATVGAWLLTGHWLAVDVIGVALVFLLVSLLHVPSLRLATMLLGGLLLYDVLFVFFSERVLGANVMVEVATQAADNPLARAARTMHLPLAPIPRVQLPVKLMFPYYHGGECAHRDQYAMLGLGDMALPGVCVAYVLRACARRERALFYVAVAGYAGGLAAAFACNLWFAAPQPALFYIVPALLLPVIWYARSRSRAWRRLRRRLRRDEEEEEEEEVQERDDDDDDDLWMRVWHGKLDHRGDLVEMREDEQDDDEEQQQKEVVGIDEAAPLTTATDRSRAHARV